MTDPATATSAGHQPVLRRPGAADYPAEHAGNIARVPAGDLIAVFADQTLTTMRLLSTERDAARADYRYAPGKWSLKQVVGHITDVERVLSCRMLRFARADATPLPGFDENDYAAAAGSDARPLADLAAELAAVRAATLALMRGLTPDAWDRRGNANRSDVSVLGIACMIVGHEIHHRTIIEERYLA